MKEKRRPFSWMNEKLEVKDTKKCGKGVFAKSDLKKNEILCIFGGYIKSLVEEEKMPKEIKDEGVQINNEFALGIIRKNQFEDSSFFNHSCNPNAGFKGQIFLVAMKNIKRGEQITFDYAMVLDKAKKAGFYKMKCLCGSNKCRGYITENDWKKTELQKKYNGYFQFFIQEKINKKIKI